MVKRIQKDGKWQCTKCKKWKLSSEFVKQSKSWNGLNPRCKECFHPGHAEYMRGYNIKTKYGISIAEYEDLLVKQGGVCVICGNKQTDPNKNERLCIDHDHETGKVRGLLCSNCNTALGLMKDDITRFARAIEYLTNKIKN